MASISSATFFAAASSSLALSALLAAGVLTLAEALASAALLAGVLFAPLLPQAVSALALSAKAAVRATNLIQFLFILGIHPFFFF